MSEVCDWSCMSKAASSEELARRIEQLVWEHIAASHQVAREALERAFASVAQTAPRPPRAKRRVHRHRTAEEVAALSEQLNEVICAHPGEGMARLAEILGSTAVLLNQPMRRLKKAGRIRVLGARSQARYFPVPSAIAAE